MNRLTQSLSAEYRKITATNMWWILAIVILGYSAMMSAVFSGMFGVLGDAGQSEGMPPIDAASTGPIILSTVSSFGYVVPLLFGAIMATGELRHRILGLAFLAEPKRGIVLTAKLVMLLAGGAVLGVAGLIGALIPAALLLPEGWVSVDLLPVLARVVLVIAMWAVIGFGVGLLLRNQAVTIVLVLVFTQFVEPMLRSAGMLWEWSANVVKFLPGSASDGTVGASILGDMSVIDESIQSSPTVFGVWVSFALLLAYAVITVAGGWISRWRGDIQ